MNRLEGKVAIITGQALSVDGGHLAHQPQIADMLEFEGAPHG
jgi:hypothetical protein